LRCNVSSALCGSSWASDFSGCNYGSVGQQVEMRMDRTAGEMDGHGGVVLVSTMDHLPLFNIPVRTHLSCETYD